MVAQTPSIDMNNLARARGHGTQLFYEPMGDEYVTLDIGEVGEYWPLVRP